MNRSRATNALPLLTLVLAAAMPLSAWPADPEPVQVARYSTIAPLPSAAQVDPLDVVVTIVFPEQLTTVDEALHYVLRRSGYRLASAEAADPTVSMLAKQPLPEVHRRLGPITVARALSTLAGPAWSMVVDPVHRLVSFELAQAYAAIGLPRDVTAAEPSHDSPPAPASEASGCDPYETWTWC
jgi:conjugative transfer region protein (TIGR03748 family)